MPKDRYRTVYNGSRLVLRKVGGAVYQTKTKPTVRVDPVVPPPLTLLEIQAKPPISEKEDAKARRARIAADLRKAFN